MRNKMQAFLLVGAGGALGAMGRYGIGVLIGKFHSGYFPIATMSVNIFGSLLMGILIGLLARFTPEFQAEARLFLAVGILGGFTTFSAFSLDVIYLFERNLIGQAASYALLSTILSVAALFLGLIFIRSVVPT